jgi:hypothetical protein
MLIHIISNEHTTIRDELLIKRIALLFQNIKQDYPLQDFNCSYVDNIEQGADLYLEIISEQEVKVGFMPETLDLRWASSESVWSGDDLHWVRVIGPSKTQPKLITQIVFFIIGLLCVPSQTGSYMTDFTDFKTAMQKGNVASLLSTGHMDDSFWSTTKNVTSSIMLLNGNSSISKKLDMVADLIPQSQLKHDYLSIMNISNTNHLPKSNQLLLIY